MRKRALKMYMTVIASMLAFFLMSCLTVYAAENEYEGVVVESGMCGNSVTYDIYRIDADNYTVVISGTGDMTDYASNSTRPWKNYSVTEIYIEDGVDSVGAYSFANIYSIKRVHLSNAISSIGDHAFYWALGVESISLPENLTIIGGHAFELCGSSYGAFEGHLDIPEGVTNIPEAAFSQAGGIESISFPNSLRTIGNYAFHSTAIQEVVLPKKLSNIGESAFSNCQMKSLTVPGSLKTISSSAFYSCTSLETVSLSEGIETIGAKAFSESNIKIIDIPGSVTYIGNLSFANSTALSAVYFMGDAPTFYSSSGTNINLVTAFNGSSVTAYYLADNTTWSRSNMTNQVTWVPWYNLETCDIIHDEVVEYTGSYLKPEVVVKCAGKELEFGDQYTLKYANNKELGQADIVITGINECRGNITNHFAIKKKLEDCGITIDSEAFFTGEEVATGHTVVDGDKVLTEGEDYSVLYENNVAIGMATAVFEGKGFYMGIVEKPFEIKEKEHVWDEGKTTTEPSCTSDGVRMYTCKGCGETRTEAIPALTHTWKEPTYKWADDFSSITATRSCENNTEDSCVETETVAVTSEITEEATCSEKGKTKYTSSNFSNPAFVAKEITVDDIDMIPHSWDEGTVIEPSTCSKEGVKIFHCTACTATKEEPVPIDPDAHDWDNGMITTDAGCTSEGVRTYVCQNNAEHTKSEAISATGHNPADPIREHEIAATCTEDGSYDEVVYCSKCNAELSREKKILDNLGGHVWGKSVYEWEDDNSTVTATRMCERGCIETETVGVTSEITKSPTCTETGNITYTSAAFANAGFEVQTNTIKTNATGHAWGEPIYTWSDDNGEVTATRVCANDTAHKETETVMTTSGVSKKATYTEMGETTYIAAFKNGAFETQSRVETNIPVLEKKENTLTVKPVTKTVKVKKLKKKVQTVAPLKVTGARGTVTYKISGSV
ncbi:MAG: leucine-rich repeat domain-containing protein [Firmicutes bacterium]|nr:leucine-rich repeat domain-containing protein [Bacillota bacterium]